MAQHDMVIDNAPGLPVRQDINAVIAALVTVSSGPVEPATKYPGMLWLDTSVTPDGLLRQRNQANNAWVAPQLSPDIRFVTQDLSFLARTGPNRFVWNDKGDGTGADVMSLTETGVLSILGVPIASGSYVERMITTSPFTWTKPAGLKFLYGEGVGPGGSGSGAAATTAGVYSFGSAGGGGSQGKKLWPAADLPASVLITLGAAGTPSTGSGVAGGTTTFGALASLPGGNAGIQGANTTGVGLIGGAAATTAPTGWTLGVAGQPSSDAFANIQTFNFNSGGGTSPYGYTRPAFFGSASANGSNAGGYGAGGSAAANDPSKAAKPSGAGAPSFIRLVEIF